MPFADYAVGLAFLAGTYGAIGAGTALLVRRRLAHLHGVPRGLAFALLATAALIGVHLLPGAVGVLSRWSVVVCALLFALAAWRLSAVSANDRADPVRVAHPESPRWSWAIAAAAVGALAVWIVARTWQATGAPPTGVDSLTFHLPNIGRWIQSGTFWQVDQFTPLLANGNYPHNGDVVSLSVVLPFENDALVGVVNAPFVVLAALAVYALATEVGAARSSATLFAAAFASLPVVTLAAYGNAQTDPIMLATFGAGLLFLLRHFRTARRSDLVLAGTGLGLSFGTKWYGVSSVAVVLIVWAGASLMARRSLRSFFRQGAALGGLVLAFGGFWLVRNLVESGNPVNPLEVSLLGVTIFDAARDFIRDCGGFTIAHYLTDTGIWREFVIPAYEENYGLPGLTIVLGTIAAVALATRRQWTGVGSRGPALALASATVLLAVAYALTPYSALGPEGRPLLVGANTRYLGPALLVGAAAAGWATGRLGRLRGPAEVLALFAVADGIRRGFDLPARPVAAALVALGVAVAAFWLATRSASLLSPPARKAFRIGLGMLALLVSVGVGYERQKTYNAGRYLGSEPAVDWILRHAPADRRIALAGVWDVKGISPVWPAFGPRIGNEVEFLGRFVKGQLREYDRRGDWGEALRRGRYDLLLVGGGGYHGCDVPGRRSDDNAWARRQGLAPLAGNARLTLYRVTDSP